MRRAVGRRLAVLINAKSIPARAASTSNILDAALQASSQADGAQEDKFVASRGRHYMSGMEAIAKLPILMRDLDRARGLNTGGFISGYRGSPLGGYDQALRRVAGHLRSRRIEVVEGINEEIAATSVWGAQQVCLFQDREVEGVFGIWYGKGPGVDRSGDAIKHANMAGSSGKGGVLCLAGDDHACKSSTLPHQSELNLRDMNVPTLVPGDVQELLELGVVGLELSRYSGCWVGMKVTSYSIDSSCTVDLDKLQLQVCLPTEEEFAMPEGGLNMRGGDDWNSQEMRMYKYKLPAVRAFARKNRLDKVVFGVGAGEQEQREGARRRLGIVSAGTTCHDVLECLEMIGIGNKDAVELGISVYKVALVWPLDEESLVEFARGCEEILVVEEKRALLELQVKDALFSLPGHPRVVGKRDESGRRLLPEEGELSFKTIARAIGESLSRISPCSSSSSSSSSSPSSSSYLALSSSSSPSSSFRRAPYFCAGCPHNSSTVVPAGSMALGGIGCHTLALFMGRIQQFTQMGGEGATWIGTSKFVKTGHVFVNVGDGTYVHSAILSIRACVAANINITFKILHNGAVAMTGGQANDTGAFSHPPAMARQLRAEGVKEVVVVAEQEEKYRGKDKEDGVRYVGRDELQAVQQHLRTVSGVTAIIYDQECATEKRRKRKRSKVKEQEQRVYIHEEVCEGCGDCGVQSNCVAIVPKETALGRKRKVDQSSCNGDLSCRKGFCPSFVSVVGGRRRVSGSSGLAAELDAITLPEPTRAEKEASSSSSSSSPSSFSVLICGIGGSGVVTSAAVMGQAAHREGFQARVLDQIGLSQKNGSVVSVVKMFKGDERKDKNTFSCARPAQVDLVISMDVVTTLLPHNLECIGESTQIVCNLNKTMPGAFTRDRDLHFPMEEMLMKLEERVGSDRVHRCDMHRLSEEVLGDAVFANVVCLGFCFQLGLLPLPAEALLGVIGEGVDVGRNSLAFKLGRLAAHDEGLVESWRRRRREGEWGGRTALEMSLDETVEDRSRRLRSYQDEALANKYQEGVREVRRREEELLGWLNGEEDVDVKVQKLSNTMARSYYKVLAIKDEFEVARLLLDGSLQREISKGMEGEYSLSFHLAPPALNWFSKSSSKKFAFPAWLAIPAFRLLRSMSFLRNTVLDPFRLSADRKLNFKLLAHFEDDVALVLRVLSAARNTSWALPAYKLSVELLEIPNMIRGYGHVREEGAAKAAERRSELLARIDSIMERVTPVTPEK